MNFFSFDELRRKNLLIALGLWLTIESVSFVLFPAIGLIDPSVRLRTGFLISVPLGVGGAVLIAATQSPVLNHKRSNRPRSIQPLIIELSGWVGLAGILFPFVIVCSEFFATLNV